MEKSENSASLSSFHSHHNKFELAHKKAKKRLFVDKFRSCIIDAKQTYKLLNEIGVRSLQSPKAPILRSCYEATPTPSNEDVA